MSSTEAQEIGKNMDCTQKAPTCRRYSPPGPHRRGLLALVISLIVFGLLVSVIAVLQDKPLRILLVWAVLGILLSFVWWFWSLAAKERQFWIEADEDGVVKFGSAGEERHCWQGMTRYRARGRRLTFADGRHVFLKYGRITAPSLEEMAEIACLSGKESPLYRGVERAAVWLRGKEAAKELFRTAEKRLGERED